MAASFGQIWLSVQFKFRIDELAAVIFNKLFFKLTQILGMISLLKNS